MHFYVQSISHFLYASTVGRLQEKFRFSFEIFIDFVQRSSKVFPYRREAIPIISLSFLSNCGKCFCI